MMLVAILAVVLLAGTAVLGDVTYHGQLTATPDDGSGIWVNDPGDDEYWSPAEIEWWVNETEAGFYHYKYEIRVYHGDVSTSSSRPPSHCPRATSGTSRGITGRPSSASGSSPVAVTPTYPATFTAQNSTTPRAQPSTLSSPATACQYGATSMQRMERPAG